MVINTIRERKRERNYLGLVGETKLCNQVLFNHENCHVLVPLFQTRKNKKKEGNKTQKRKVMSAFLFHSFH